MSWWRLRKCRYRLCSLPHAWGIKFAYPRIAHRTRTGWFGPCDAAPVLLPHDDLRAGVSWCEKNHPAGVIVVNAISGTSPSRRCPPVVTGGAQQCGGDTGLPATGSANPVLAAATTNHRRALPRWRGSVPACAGWSGPACPDSRSFPDSSRWQCARQPGLR